MKRAILFGGVSYEHEISIVSAISLKELLKENLEFIFLDSLREFYHIPPSKMRSTFFSSGEYKKCNRLSLKNSGFYKDNLFSSKKVDISTVINLVHGGDGEDGKLASLFEFFGVDFIGPRVEASVISFSKLYTKLYAKELGIKVVDYQLLSNQDRDIKFDFPVIVKPSRLGSSIGVTVVKDQSELDYALDVAYEFDTDIVIEPFIEDVKEYNLAGCYSDKFIFSIVEEPDKKEFLDFDKKYLDFSRSGKVLKADIPQELEESMQEKFKRVYNTLFRGSLIRCDFFVIDNQVYLNEINPIPGSYSNYLFEDFSSVIDTLCKNLPKYKKLDIEYLYINSIAKAKGK